MADRILRTETEYSEKPPCRTAEEMEELCCHPREALPCCMKVGPYSGHEEKDALEKLGIELDDEGRDANGHKVVIEWKPRKHPCGWTETEFNLEQKDCCEGVSEVSFPPAYNPSVIADYSSALLYIGGGKGPFTLITENENIYFKDANGWKTRRLVTEQRWNVVYADDHCGTAEIMVLDACDQEAYHYLRSPDGQWQTIEFRDYKAWCYYDCGQGHPDFSCTPQGADDSKMPPLSEVSYDYQDWPSPPEGNWTRQGMMGPYRLTEQGGQAANGVVRFAAGTTISSCTGGCAEKGDRLLVEGYPPWEPCLGKPAGWVLFDIKSPGISDCLLWSNGVPCAQEDCGQEWGYFKDRYGVVTCGTATYILGMGIDSRRWEEWVC